MASDQTRMYAYGGPPQDRLAPQQPHVTLPPVSALQQQPYQQPPPFHGMHQTQAPIQTPIQTQIQASIQTAATNDSSYRPLNVKDALSYLEQVKLQFGEQPEVYNRFLDIMKDFKSQTIDTPGVIERVSGLFRGHPNLIIGFNTFLPPGYKIEPTNNPSDPVRVTTPRDPQPFAMHQPADVAVQPMQQPDVAIQQPIVQQQPLQQPQQQQPQQQQLQQLQEQPQRAVRGPVEFNHAINYVNKIKNRFSSEPDTYKQFLEILQTYQKEQKPIQEVYAQVRVLFEGAPDLLDEFKQFLPDNSNPATAETLRREREKREVKDQPKLQKPSKPSQRFTDANYESARWRQNAQAPHHTAPPPKKKLRTHAGNVFIPTAADVSHSASAKSQFPATNVTFAKGDRPSNIEEIEFFEKCKRAIGNKASYNEFLKILNLFSQEIIEAKTLVERAEPFLSRDPELISWFKKYVKYEGDEVVFNIPADRPEIDLRICRRSGHSYRKLPKDIPRPVCSGRDEVCKEVLNNDWISHPVYVSETGFVAHKKTPYEEAMYKCEEERYEFDLNIESNLSVIALLEPICKKIQAMTPEERGKFKLPPNLGGHSTAIYQRVIRKIYDKDRGNEVIEALQQNPAIAVPVVLKRLKQKDEEWKRSQREWSKVWREIDTKNCSKALDHQGIHFKTTDRKAINVKSLVTEIEMLQREQREKRTSLANRYQFDFSFKKCDIFTHVRRILARAVERPQTLQLNDADRIQDFLKDFVKRFFLLDDLDGYDDENEELAGAAFKDKSLFDNINGDSRHGSPTGSFSPQKGNNGSAALSAAGSISEQPQPSSQPSVHRQSPLQRHDAIMTDSVAPTQGAADMDVEANPLVTDKTTVSPVGCDVPMDGTTSPSPLASVPESSEKSEPTQRKRTSYSFYANTTIYAFFRLYQMLFSRMKKMKELSDQLKGVPTRNEMFNPVARELGFQKDLGATFTEKDRYRELIKHIYPFVCGDMEANEFEDRTRVLYWTSGYLVFTIDKLVNTLVRQMQTIVTDPKSMDLIALFYRDQDKPTGSSRQEALYRLAAETLMQEENVYRLEFFIPERVLTVQLLGNDDQLSDDAISSEERWSLYVDQFVQLSMSESSNSRRNEPFLKRNLPTEVGEDPPLNVETQSGLELKICVNTYKIFFVDNTEDYFRRKRSGAPHSLLGLDPATRSKVEASSRTKCSSNFASWLESASGWRKGLTDEQAQQRNDAFNAWVKGTDNTPAEDERHLAVLRQTVAVPPSTTSSASPTQNPQHASISSNPSLSAASASPTRATAVENDTTPVLATVAQIGAAAEISGDDFDAMIENM